MKLSIKTLLKQCYFFSPYFGQQFEQKLYNMVHLSFPATAELHAPTASPLPFKLILTFWRVLATTSSHKTHQGPLSASRPEIQSLLLSASRALGTTTMPVSKMTSPTWALIPPFCPLQTPGWMEPWMRNMRVGCQGPCVRRTDAGFWNCCKQRWRGWRGGANRWSRMRERMSFQKTVSNSEIMNAANLDQHSL